LRGQVRKLIGTAISIMKGWLPIDYLEALLSPDDVFDAPSAPGWPMYLAESKYDRFEAKYGIRLDARRIPVVEVTKAKQEDGVIVRNESTDEYRGHENQCRGMDFHDLSPEVVNTELCKNPDFLKFFSGIVEWKSTVRAHIVQKYCTTEQDWLGSMEIRCKELREKYANLILLQSRVKEDLSQMMLSISTVVPMPLQSGNTITVKAAYANVLRLLEEADRSGNWPLTSLARQKILFEPTAPVETVTETSGSFSVGVYPAPLAEPKGNKIFPELVIACFLLERVISPGRPPSSTIAINRHAQFRPHRDSGAGNGQSGSLIVGLGDYTGGELIVEGVPVNIRYQPLGYQESLNLHILCIYILVLTDFIFLVEFDGWKERHWTLPFHGSRYSLVWFTPLGVHESDFFWLDEIRKFEVAVL